MNNVFTAKLLQNLRSKKGDKGFTLIELLVVVIIIGVLAAIALPNLLGQVAKGRQSEAKNNLGAINRGQQAIRLEDGVFGVINAGNVVAPTPDNPATPAVNEFLPGVPLLDVVVTAGNYQYDDIAPAGGFVPAGDGIDIGQTAIAIASLQNDIRDYQASSNQQANGTFIAVICESDALDGAAVATAPTPGTLAAFPACAAGTTQIK